MAVLPVTYLFPLLALLGIILLIVGICQLKKRKTAAIVMIVIGALFVLPLLLLIIFAVVAATAMQLAVPPR